MNAAPWYCEGEISVGQLKSFTIYPEGSRDICYIPNGGGASKLGAIISFWDYNDAAEPPDVTVDMYVTANTSRATYWTYLTSIQAKPWWKYSSPLWLNSGVVYIFQISASRLSQVNIQLKPY